MTTEASSRALIRLMAWLSPAFPVGGFAYSGGLESAVQDGQASDPEALRLWFKTLLARGTWRNDGLLLAEAWRSIDDPTRLADAATLAEALAGSAERHLEIMTVGEAFAAAAAAWPHPALDSLGSRPPYSVALGVAAAAQSIPLEDCLAAFYHALLSQAISAAIRLGVIGQRQGVALLARFEEAIVTTARDTAGSSLEDLGSAAIGADIASLRHETQQTRLFRS
ncbi:urease accessory protein [Rhizobium sp. SG_E_25_P2]|uniref:urease accessory protein UreF n=1 Tax=Rhizobium sp. SG_E_25_P2 TaxID=2879942 RepID=UPI00247476E9|nr:urease accessory protein UreF [Rhizobium sp. SG_E_25_P2]MDH6265705.1 urease accessory protein [Rhizobium sp. SG_E_25_P2]